MANARIEFKIGDIEFVCEGEQEWVTDQLDKILNRLPHLEKESVKNSVKQTPQSVSNIHSNTHADLFSEQKTDNDIPVELSTFLQKKDAIEKQRRRFLATAVWLQLNGKQLVMTKEVTDALRAARQMKITNPSHQLNQNMAQGFCQREGRGFYVTPQGVENIM